MTKVSLQENREAYAAGRRFLNTLDPDFVNGIEKRFDALKEKSDHPADFRRLSNDIKDWLNKHVNKKDWKEDVDQPTFDAAMAFRNMVDIEIENRAIALNIVGSSGGAAAGDGSWRNAQTGNPVEIFNANEKISKGHVHGQSPATVGTLLNGIMFGARSDAVKNALSEGTDSAGGYGVPTHVLREFFDKLRARSTFVQAGARTLLLDAMKTRIVRIASDPQPAWRAENAAITESQPTFEAVDFVAKSLAVLVKVSWEVLADSVNIEEALEASLLGALSVELDRACLFGAGTATEPLGLFGTAGINSVSLGTNGAQIANYDPFVDGLYEIEARNAGPAMAAIYHPRTARTLRKLKDTTNQPLVAPDEVRELKRLISTSVPINQTQGTETAASSIILGDFSQAILGLRESLTIQRLDQAYAGNGQVGFIARLRADVGFAHPESFSKVIGVKP